jgi:hypothetical protein
MHWFPKSLFYVVEYVAGVKGRFCCFAVPNMVLVHMRTWYLSRSIVVHNPISEL